MADGSRPVPAVNELTQPYWDAARKHRLVMQWCPACQRFQHPPAPQCQGCRSDDLQWAPVSGSQFRAAYGMSGPYNAGGCAVS